ncbi:hypothetical protein ccbrp13_29930 [Ktedonobacteria bacterium brp13]|nr:hypothetical protein ccbrp13_29930 [Ktedonobacteria bacterium brp13]
MSMVKVAFKEAGWIFFISRLVILVITFLGVSLLPMSGSNSSCLANPSNCIRAWMHFDVFSYIYIAMHGYDAERATVFFPLWPLLLHSLGFLAGGSDVNFYLIGMVLANLFFYLALVVLYLLTANLFEQGVAQKALLYLAFAPYALFFFIGYTESLFLLLCLTTFLFLQRGLQYGVAINWWLAGLCGLLASLTRSQGFLLTVPFILVFAQHYILAGKFTMARWREKIIALLPIVLVPTGVVLYMCYLWYTKGNPMLFSVAEARDWHRAFRLPWVGLHAAVRGLFIPGGLQLQNALNLGSFLVTLLILVSGWKRLPLYYTLFALVLIIFPLCYPLGTADALAALPRYMLIVFPIIIISASWKQQRVVALYLAFTITLFIFNCLLFSHHYWVA